MLNVSARRTTEERTAATSSPAIGRPSLVRAVAKAAPTRQKVQKKNQQLPDKRPLFARATQSDCEAAAAAFGVLNPEFCCPNSPEMVEEFCFFISRRQPWGAGRANDRRNLGGAVLMLASLDPRTATRTMVTQTISAPAITFFILAPPGPGALTSHGRTGKSLG